MSQAVSPSLKRLALLLLQAFKDGDVRFLVCTDVAARGIDIAGLPYMVNMTLPDKPEDYIHRVGRVGAPFRHCMHDYELSYCFFASCVSK